MRSTTTVQEALFRTAGLVLLWIVLAVGDLSSWIIALPTIALAVSGCSTIYFHNGPGRSRDVGADRFHHILLSGIEITDPVELEQRCRGRGWTNVKTELTFVVGLVRAFTAPIYNPWGVAWGCR